jgi:hypothetical protein
MVVNTVLLPILLFLLELCCQFPFCNIMSALSYKKDINKYIISKNSQNNSNLFNNLKFIPLIFPE